MVFIFTVFAVSLDAYLASFAYNAKNRLGFLSLWQASSYTFIFSAIALLLNNLYVKNLPYVNEMGGVLLSILGLKNYLSYFDKTPLFSGQSNRNSTMLGIAVSIDAAVACLSVSPINYGVILPYAFAMYIGHFVFLLLGAYSSKLVVKANSVSLMSGVCLMVLGISKLI